MMQDLSFNLGDPAFTFGMWTFGVQVFTYENIYGLDADQCHTVENDTRLTVTCNGLTWAGGQVKIAGTVSIVAQAVEDHFQFTIKATFPGHVIRCVKLLLMQIPDGEIINLRETPTHIVPPGGLILKYPDGWRGLYTPLVILKTTDTTADAGYLYFRSLDTQVREKRFAFVRPPEQPTKTQSVELIFEQLATQPADTIDVPIWEVGYCATPEPIMRKQQVHVQRAYNLTPWVTRSDVPTWARNISLIAAIHCQHFTGYVFNDYAQVLDTIRWLAARIDPEQLLIYLPGWEGRYYWQYGAYRPDPRMGGEAGFAKMVSSARELGVHVMPMFGINFANRGLPNYEQWGAPGAFMSPAGSELGSASVDWDASRHHDHGWQALLNPGTPGWQNHLTEQIRTLITRYGFDGVFLDISAAFWNDPRFAVYPGTAELIRRLTVDHPEVLIAGEGWFDAMSALTPLMQSGHTDGVFNWHDVPDASFFDEYARSFAHLCLGDPGRGSTGVHELGYNAIQRSPIRKGIIPTVTIVEDTLRVAADKVEQIIEDARLYSSNFRELNQLRL